MDAGGGAPPNTMGGDGAPNARPDDRRDDRRGDRRDDRRDDRRRSRSRRRRSPSSSSSRPRRGRGGGGSFKGGSSVPNREPVQKVGVWLEIEQEEQKRGMPLSAKERDEMMRNHQRKLQGLPPLPPGLITGHDNAIDKGKGKGKGKDKGKDKGKGFGKDKGKGKW
eukprot:TRINITY_DN3567_c2_g3_i2.p1 TRINITY_DN3567_c2_g3~~TRINITY_DN3567_c2_g3_i2.p1  ORF type:complete len:165 (-),score=50.53 TRINITY_DN3567_c2_g3_i2:441-935(-)